MTAKRFRGRAASRTDLLQHRNYTAGYAYDTNGNMTSDGVNSLVYDGENRLVSSADGSGTATYVYDASGHRVIKTFGGTTVVYIYDGDRTIGEYNNGTFGGREYIYLGNRVLLAEAYGTAYYYLRDRSSVRVVADANGNIYGQVGMYPFGEDWYMQTTTTERHFTSYLRDAESGNDYALAREYVNRLARFSALDPSSPQATDPQQWNRYAYVGGDPVNRVDLTGRFCELLIGDCDPFFDPECGCCDPFFDISCNPFPIILPIIFIPMFGCPGTTDCSYYSRRCHDPNVPNKNYYCNEAPAACQAAGTTKIANCIRLCLQAEDKCFSMPAGTGFDICITGLHVSCAAQCAIDLSCYL